MVVKPRIADPLRGVGSHDKRRPGNNADFSTNVGAAVTIKQLIRERLQPPLQRE